MNICTWVVDINTRPRRLIVYTQRFIRHAKRSRELTHIRTSKEEVDKFSPFHPEIGRSAMKLRRDHQYYIFPKFFPIGSCY